jgi:predicted house-cleaning noncanonical NTP pyrophosphatase (MazG superfamily)
MSSQYRVIHEKLVRDRIPEIITAAGQTPVVRTLSPDEYGAALLAKLREELDEFIVSQEIAELVDLVEVIQAIVERRDLEWHEFEMLRARKRLERGGFRDRAWLESVEHQE